MKKNIRFFISQGHFKLLHSVYSDKCIDANWASLAQLRPDLTVNPSA